MSATRSDTELLDLMERELVNFRLCEIKPTFLSEGHWQVSYKIEAGRIAHASGGGRTLREALNSMLDVSITEGVRRKLQL